MTAPAGSAADGASAAGTEADPPWQPSGVAVGIDVGGTKLVGGLVASDGSVLARRRIETPHGSAGALADGIAGMATDLWEVGAVGPVPVGLGAAGIVDGDGTMRYAPNIPAWRDYPLGSELAQRIHAPVVVDNDANVAAWGEYTAGAGRHAVSMLMLTVGTGVGGGLVLDDRLVRGAHGLAGEFGHVIVAEGGPRCSCGNRGCLEALASGTAIGRTAGELIAEGRAPERTPLHEPGELSGKRVTVAAQGGDPFARAVLDRCGFWLGVGIATLVNALDPAIVVVGGGAMEAGELLLEPARAAFGERLVGSAHRPVPPITAATLGDDAGLVGAALLALAGQGA